MNPCRYCKEDNYPHEESSDYKKLSGVMTDKREHDGDIIEETRTLKWSHIYRVHHEGQTTLQRFPDYYEPGESR